MVGFKTLNTYDFLMVAITFIVHLMADRKPLREKCPLCIVDRGIGREELQLHFLQFPWLIKVGAKSGELRNFIVGLEHRITLKVEFNFRENSPR